MEHFQHPRTCCWPCPSVPPRGNPFSPSTWPRANHYSKPFLFFSLSPSLTQISVLPSPPLSRSPDPAAGRSDRAGLQRKPWRPSAALLPCGPPRGPAGCRAGPGASGAQGTPRARSLRCLTTAHPSVYLGTLLSGAGWPGRSGEGPAPGGPPALCCSSGPAGGERPRKVRLGLEGMGPDPPLTSPPPQLSGPPGFLAPGTTAPLSLRIASFSGPQDLYLRTSAKPSFALTSNLSR